MKSFVVGVILGAMCAWCASMTKNEDENLRFVPGCNNNAVRIIYEDGWISSSNEVDLSVVQSLWEDIGMNEQKAQILPDTLQMNTGGWIVGGDWDIHGFMVTDIDELRYYIVISDIEHYYFPDYNLDGIQVVLPITGKVYSVFGNVVASDIVLAKNENGIWDMID